MSVNRVALNYLHTLRILNKTRQLSKKTVTLKYVKKQYQDRTNSNMTEIGQLYAGYLRELKEYNVNNVDQHVLIF
jgi:hypothetical protein